MSQKTYDYVSGVAILSDLLLNLTGYSH